MTAPSSAVNPERGFLRVSGGWEWITACYFKTVSASAFYRRFDDQFQATELTRGPWSRDHQHGGPVAALLGRAIEGTLERERRVVRFVIELYKPVPIARFTVTVETVQAGRSTSRVRASLLHEGRVVATATALAVLAPPLGVELEETTPVLPPPDHCPVVKLPLFLEPVGYHTAMELRVAAGQWGAGRMTAWMRATVPLVDDEAPSPLSRVLLAADSGNGVSARLDTRQFSFVNPELSVHLARPARGEWIALEAETRLDGGGTGLSDTRLHDAFGPIGRGLQPLIVTRRG